MSKAPQAKAPEVPADQKAAAAAAAAMDRAVTPMDLQRFKGREYMVSDYVCTAHPHTEPEDLLKPEYWAHVSTHVTPRTSIEAWGDDGTWMARYVVLEAGRNWAKLHMTEKHRLTTVDVALTQAEAMSPYEITHRGPHCQWSVIRKKDNQVVHEGEATRDGAVNWLRERLKAE